MYIIRIVFHYCIASFSNINTKTQNLFVKPCGIFKSRPKVELNIDMWQGQQQILAGALKYIT